MPRLRRGSSAALLLLMMTAAACTQTAPGTFHVKFVWPDGSPTLTEPLYIFARVEERAVSPTTAGAVLALAGPVSYTGHGAQLEFGSVPHGHNRVVVIELHQTSSTASQVIYYGLSQPFTLAAGDDAEVPVLLKLQVAPGVTPPGGTPPTSSLAIVAPLTPGYVNTATVDLVLASDTGVSVKVANQLGGIDSAPLHPVSDLAPVDGQANAHRLSGWDLNAGRTDSATACDVASAQEGCSRTVFAQFIDPNGYVSPVVSAQVVLDEVAPSLLHPRANPSAARAGDTVVFSLEPNEPLSTAPVPSVTPLDSQPAVALLFEEGTRYIFTHTVSDGEPDGRFTAAFALTDLAGNIAAAEPQPPIEFQSDSHPPRISNLATARSRFSGVAGFNTGSITFDVTEAVDGPNDALVVLVDGAPATCSSWQSTSPSYTCLFTVPPTGISGTKAITVKTQDAAQNGDFASTSVVFDYDPPRLLASEASPALAGLGQEVSILVLVSEYLQGTPSLLVQGPQPLTFSGTASGTTFTFQTRLPTTDPTGAFVGTYASTLSLTDDVGNVAIGLSGPTFAVDTQAPTISDVVILNGAGVSASRFSTVTGFDTLLVAFDVSKEIAHATVTIGPVVLTNCSPSPAGSLHLVCAYAVDGTEPETALPISIQVTDAAGNTATAGATATFDFTPPDFVSSSASPAIAGLGQTETIAFTSTEALASVPDLLVAPGGRLLFSSNASGTAYSFTTSVPSVDPGGALGGDYRTTLRLVDLAGNAALLEGPVFSVDSAAPAVSGLVVSNAEGSPSSRFSSVSGFNRVNVSFHVSKPIQSAILSLAREPQGACAERAPGTNDYACDYGVTGGEPETSVPLSVQVADAAGNTASAETIITFDFTPPALSAPSSAPAVVGLGSTETLGFTASEPLQATPILTVAGPATLNFSALASGTAYFYSTTIAGSDPSNALSGRYTTTAVLVDLAGNSATVAGPSFEIDSQRPTITGLRTVSASGLPATAFSSVAGFSALGIEFDVSESVASVSVNAGATSIPDCSPVPAGTAHYVCRYTVTGTESEATTAVTVLVSDTAGNSSHAETPITLDFTAPTLVWRSATPPIVGLGQTELLQVSASEALSNTPALSVDGPAPLTFASSVSGSTFLYQATLPASDPSGSRTGAYSTTLSLVDGVGNRRVVDGPSFVVDTVAPTVSNLKTTNALGGSASRFSARPSFNEVLATFAWNSWQREVPSSLTVLLGGIPMDCLAQSPWAAPYEISCAHQVDGTEPETTLPITIQAADQANNRTTDGTTVTLDFSPPDLLSQATLPPVARLGGTETLVLTVDEALLAPPALTLTGPAGLTFTSAASGTTWTLSADVPATDPANAYTGSYSTEVLLTDTVGNSQSVSGPAFSVDAFPPTLSSLVTNGAVFSAVSGHNSVAVSFDAAESVDGTGASLSATLGGRAMTCGTYQPQTPRYSCRYDVTGTEGEGPQPIFVNAIDAAGNHASLTGTVTFDFTAPSLFSQTVSVPKAGLGERELLTLTPNETLAGAPTVAVIGPGGVVPFTLIPQTAYAYQASVTFTAANSAGTYASTVSMTDPAGNSRTVVGPSFDYDPVVPILSNLSTSGTAFSAVPGHNTLIVALDSAKSLDAPGRRLSVTVGGLVASCGAYSPTTPNYSCSYTVQGTETEGPQTIVAQAIDEYSNSASRTGTVTFDFTAPSLLAASASPPLVGVAQVESVLITASEPLAGTPTLTVTGAQGPLSFTYVSGSAWFFTHTVLAGTPSGSYLSKVLVSDVVGNVATLQGPTFVVDSVPPTIANLTAVGGHEGKTFSAQPAYRDLSLTFDTPKALDDAASSLSVTVGGHPLSCDPWKASAPNYVCRYVVDGSETEGTQPIVVATRDGAGNTGNATKTVVFDFTPPSLLSSSSSPPIVGVGQQESLLLTASEPLSETPALAVDGSSGSLDFAPVSGSTYGFARTLLPTDQGGIFTPHLTMTDLVGNVATVSGASFQVDTVVPAVTALVVSGGYQGQRFSTQTGFNQLSVAFNTPKSLDGAGASVLALVSGQAMTCSAYQAAAPNYTCRHTVAGDEGEGARPVLIQTKDAAGNAGGATSTVTFDFTPPILLSPSVAPTTVGVGQVENLFLTASETLSASPSLVVQEVGGALLSFSSIPGTTYAFQRNISVGDISSTYAPRLSMTDLVGNSAEVTGPTFVVDTIVPTITNVTTSGVLFSAQAGHNALSIQFDTAKPLESAGDSVSVSVGGVPVPCSYSATATSDYTCDYTVDGTEGDGPKSVLIRTVDEAGNSDSQTTTVTFDFTPPSLASQSAGPVLAGLGAVESLSLTASETLASLPSLTVSSGVNVLTFTLLSGSAYTYQRTISAGDASSDYTSAVTLIDLAGNTATVAGPSFSVDTNVPTVSSLTANASLYSAVSGHRSAVVTFNTTKTLDTAGNSLLATFAGQSMACSTRSATAPNYTCSYTVTGTETEGTQPVVVSTRDTAGNSDLKTLNVTLDFTAPSLAAKSAAPSLAGVGTVESLSLTASEALASTPTIAVTNAGHTLTFALLSGSAYTFQKTIAAADFTGAYTSMITLTDLAGNAATVAGPSFSVDTNVPTISSLTANASLYSAVSGHRSAVVTFNTTKTLDTPGNSLLATFAGQPMTCGTRSATVPNYTCGYTVTGAEAEGTQPVVVSTRDTAGNSDLKTLNVTLDFTAPSLAAKSAAPSLAGVGTVESLSLTASEALASTPTIAVTSAGHTLTFALLSGSAYTFQKTIAAADFTGAYTSTITLTDLAGNTATVAGPSFSVDTNVPTISSLTANASLYSAVSGHRSAVVTFNTTKTLDTPGNSLLATFAGQPMTCGTRSATAPNYTCSYTVTGAEAEGSQLVVVSTRDTAGNSDTRTLGVTLDFTAPSLVASSAAPALAGVGTIESIALTPSEALSNTPVVSISGPGGAALAVGLLSGSTYVFQGAVGAANASGSYTSTVALTDRAGNTQTVSGPSFSVDSMVPTISGILTNASTFSAQAGHRHLIVSFSTPKSLDSAGSAVSAVISNQSLTCSSYTVASPNYTCTYDVMGTEGEGQKLVTISASDAAGNSDTRTVPVTLDFTAPTLSASSAAPSLAPIAAVESLSLTPSEALLTAPLLTVTTGNVTLTFTLLTGSAYTFQRTIGSSDPSGTYSSSLVLTDLVGNTATVAGPSFSLDTLVPRITNAATNRSTYSAQAGFRHIALTFDATKSLDSSGSSLTASVAGKSLNCGTYSASSPNYTCGYNVDGSEAEGAQTVAISTQDAAGNSDSKTLPVTFDFTPPSLVSQSASPELAGVGTVESLSLTASEPLSAHPTVSVGDPGALLDFTVLAGSSYTLQRTITPSDPSGVYTARITASDLVGNQASLVGPTFSVDTNVPVISLVSTDRSRYSANPGYRVITMGFNTSKPLEVLSVVMSGSCPLESAGTCAFTCSSRQETSPNYTCAYVVTGTEVTPDGTPVSSLSDATLSIVVQGADAARNATSQSTSVVLDFTAPAMANAAARPSLAGDGASLFVFLTATETLSGAPVLRAAGTTTGATQGFNFLNGSTYTYQANINAGSAVDDSYGTTVSMTDLVGNTATLLPGPSFQIDTARISITNLVTNRTLFSRVSGYNQVQAEFDLSETPDSLDVPFAGTATTTHMNCSNAGLHYTCTQTIGAAWAAETAASLTVIVSDRAGNQATKSASIAFDFTDPSLSGIPTTLYVPNSGNLLSSVTAATVGSTVQVAFSTSEPLSADPVVTLLQSGTPMTLVSSVGTSYFYALTVSTGSPPDRSSYTLQFTLTDVVGNSSTVNIVPAPRLAVDTVVPAAPETSIAADLITYTRIPWGAASTSGVPTFSVAGLAGAVPSNSTVAVFDGPNLSTASELGRATATSAGTFNVSLARTDHPTVYVTALDAAGNVSAASTVRKVVWKASFGGKSSGKTFKNPHILEAASDFEVRNVTTAGVAEGSLDQPSDSAAEVASYAGVITASDGSTVSASATPMSWAESSVTTSPGSGIGRSLTFDSARGVAVLYGGQLGFNDTGDLFEWDGSGWSKPSVVGSSPGARRDFSLAYDPVVGATVLFGGMYGGYFSVQNDLWQWDGRSWSAATQSGAWPTQRYAAAMAYDSSRGVLVLFGGRTTGLSTNATNDTWEWDGASWKDVTPGGSSPAARGYASMVYDSTRQVMVLVGGLNTSDVPLNDTWEWNGVAWTERTLSSGNPVARSSAGLSFDTVRGVSVLFAGMDASSASLADTWEWNGTSWSQITPSTSAGMRSGHGMTFDPIRQRTVIFGGEAETPSTVKLADTWLYDGSHWVESTPSDAQPSKRSGTALAYDTARKTNVLFGGEDSTGLRNDTWIWNGARWSQAAPATSPSARKGFVLVNDASRNVVLLFGGQDSTGAVGDTWKWDGSNWTNVVPLTSPPAGSTWAATFDSTRNQPLIIGPGTTDADVWVWNGTRWLKLVTTGDVPAESNLVAPYTIAYDASRDVVVMWGNGTALMWEFARSTRVWTAIGYGPIGAVLGGAMVYDNKRGVVYRTGGKHDSLAYDDSWEFDGSSWTDVTATGTRPSARYGLAAAFDSDQGVVTVFGGKDSQGSLLGDTWVGTAGTRRRAAALAHFNFGAAGASLPVVKSMVFAVRAGAAGNTTAIPGRGVSSAGTTLFAWDRQLGGWKSLDTNTSDSASPTLLSYSTASATEAVRYVYGAGDEQQIQVAAMSTKSAGNGTTPPQVAVDSAELTVTYNQTQELCDTLPCQCGASEVSCNGSICVDTSVDLNNCGSCGNACASGKSCVSGTCQ